MSSGSRALSSSRRRFTLLAAAAAFGVPGCRAEELSVRLENGQLKVSAPPLGILGGEVFQRLKIGKIVPFDFHLALWLDDRRRAHSRAFERFAVSYDLWEETFAVTGLRAPRASASGLNAREVESWCLDHIGLPVANLRAAQTAWMRLDIRAVPPKEAESPFEESTIDLNVLIELLSRSSRRKQDRWSIESGPVRVSSLLAESRGEALRER